MQFEISHVNIFLSLIASKKTKKTYKHTRNRKQKKLKQKTQYLWKI